MAKANPICGVEGCDKPSKQRVMCWMHYERVRKHGRLTSRVAPCATCGVEIDRGSKTGPMPRFCSVECKRATYRKPGPIDGKCEGCGGVITRSNAMRNVRYCHPGCRQLKNRAPNRPRVGACSQCGAAIDFQGRDESGRLRRTSREIRCGSCSAKARPHRYGMTAAQIAERDGVTCRWCAKEVDFSLVGTRSKWAPSIDHIKPWSRGGTNEPGNLQLLHRVCNAEKGTQVL